MAKMGATKSIARGFTLALLFLLYPTVCAAQKNRVIVVNGPTVVAFFPPVTTRELSKDPDTNESLADFQEYATRVRGQLHAAGIDFEEILCFVVTNQTSWQDNSLPPEENGSWRLLC
jgi:hypothetical protein